MKNTTLQKSNVQVKPRSLILFIIGANSLLPSCSYSCTEGLGNCRKGMGPEFSPPAQPEVAVLLLTGANQRR